MKRLQNKIAESGFTLPTAAIYAIGVWLLSGLLERQLWIQLACYALSVYLIVEISNANALLRVRSRMVSSMFIMLSCTMCFQFTSLSISIIQLLGVASLLLLLTTYQDQDSQGRVFYTFTLLGTASILCVQVLYLIPLVLIMMRTQLQSLSWRTLMASILGLLCPYWFISLWFLYQRDYDTPISHFYGLVSFQVPFDYSTVTLGQWLCYAMIVLAIGTGSFNFWRNSYEEKIRTRLFYGLFVWMTMGCLLITALQPQLYTPMMSLAVIFASPLIAHFMALTNTRISNIVFFVIIALTIVITAFNLWTLSLSS